MWRLVVQCLGQVAGWLLMLTGSGAVLLTWCLMGDDRSSDSVILGMAVFSVIFLGSGAKLVWGSGSRVANRPNPRSKS